jgi:hypothetical protein
MKKHTLRFIVLTAMIAMLAVILACAGNIEPQTVPISVPYPEGFADTSITLEFGAASIYADAIGSDLIEGNITYNTEGRYPAVVVNDNSVSIVQGGPSGIVTGGTINNWVLHFGTEMPFSLEINAGAYSGEWKLGGLPLTALTVNEGAASSTFSFSSANPEVMSELDINTGAGSMDLLDLANANFDSFSYDGGAGSLTADFGGVLTHDEAVDINAGAASIALIIPEETPARIHIGGGAASIEADEGFERLDSDYSTPSWAGHEGPALEIEITLVAGSLTLQLE